MGARVNRVGLTTAIESLRGFPTGVLPPRHDDARWLAHAATTTYRSTCTAIAPA